MVAILKGKITMKCLQCEGEGVMLSESGKRWTCEHCRGTGNIPKVEMRMIKRTGKAFKTRMEVFGKKVGEKKFALLFRHERPASNFDLYWLVNEFPGYENILVKQIEITPREPSND